MTRRYRFDREAARDINENFDYIALDNLPAAQRYTRGLFETIGSIANNPQAGKFESEFSNLFDADIRSFRHRNHRFFYSPESGTIRVLRVLHTSRDIPGIMQKHLERLRERDSE